MHETPHLRLCSKPCSIVQEKCNFPEWHISRTMSLSTTTTFHRQVVIMCHAKCKSAVCTMVSHLVIIRVTKGTFKLLI